MREIKFRAWNKEYKKLFYGEKQESGMVSIWIENPDVYDLMQFTGLKDKNGKEIYEGDIYKETEYDDTMSIPELPRLFHWLGEHIFVPSCTEVIGNIYENPQLLPNQ